MDAALLLQAPKTGSPAADPTIIGGTGVPIPHGGIPLFEQGVLGKGVVLHVVESISLGPAQQWTQRPALPDRIEGLHATAVVRLGPAHPAGPTGHPQIGEGPIEGFHLANAVIELEGFSRAYLPKPAMEGFHAGRTHRRLGDVHVEIQQLRKLLGVEVGLGGEIARIHPNHLHRLATRPAQLTDHVQQHGRLNAKTGGEGKPLPEGLLGPGEPFLGR